jgi:diguanylate cyclase (GGDEF)-like protein/PAS domain S-box-containing protein
VLLNSDIQIDPIRSRRVFAAFTIGALVIIWGSYFITNYTIRKGLERALVQNVQSTAFLLEDHASRSLDTVVAKLKLAASITEWNMIWTERLSSERLRDLISDTPMLRSLSLVDWSGRVIASSDDFSLGLIVPFEKLPTPTRLDDVVFGENLPFRDLNGLVDGRAEADLSLWLAALSVEIDGTRLRWIAGINPGYFENFWARADDLGDYELSLFDFSGRHIFGHNRLTDEAELVETALGRALQFQDIGSLSLGQDGRWKLAYRGSPNHPVVLGVIGDRDRSFAKHMMEEFQRVSAALIASLTLLLVMSVIYRVYTRYEVSVTEMLNQSRAISAHLMVSEADYDGNIVAANQAFIDRTGYTESELLGKNYRILNSGLYDTRFYSKLWNAVKSGRIWKGILRNIDKDGNYFWVNATIVPFKDPWDRVLRFVSLQSDITEAVKMGHELRGERRLRRQLSKVNQNLMTEANTDMLTAVANRRGYAEFGARAIEASRDSGRPISVLMLDLDHFKNVNDTYGHVIGDVVLQEMARRWSRQLRSSDLLARLGGEEFCVVLPDTTAEQAELVATKLLNVTRQKPITFSSEHDVPPLPITVSIGIAGVERVKTEDMDDLIAAADEALYNSKRNGRDRISIAGRDRGI